MHNTHAILTQHNIPDTDRQKEEREKRDKERIDNHTTHLLERLEMDKRDKIEPSTLSLDRER